MIYDPDLLDKLETIGGAPLSEEVFRIMRKGVRADRENTRGARWNPRETGCIYTSLLADTARAEVKYRLSVEPLPIRSVEWELSRIAVSLDSVLNLSAPASLAIVGLSRAQLASDDYAATQLVGGAAALLGHDGLIVPSVRHSGRNLIIFPNNQGPGYEFEIREVVACDLTVSGTP